MTQLPGVYQAKKKNGSIYYRASFTFKSRHISLGSYPTESEAHNAYLEASNIRDTHLTLTDYNEHSQLSYEKWISIINFKHNNVYIGNPIYLHKYYFSYYISRELELTFDIDDLFYYSNHKIFKKGNYLFVNDFGMQVNILTRYGIKNHAIINKDYQFIDGNKYNYRYHNIKIINPYYGVEKQVDQGISTYLSKINIVGQHIIGFYSSAEKAAIAYNKIADFLNEHHITNKVYPRNYIDNIDSIAYSSIYNKIRIPEKFINLKKK